MRRFEGPLVQTLMVGIIECDVGGERLVGKEGVLGFKEWCSGRNLDNYDISKYVHNGYRGEHILV